MKLTRSQAKIRALLGIAALGAASQSFGFGLADEPAIESYNCHTTVPTPAERTIRIKINVDHTEIVEAVESARRWPLRVWRGTVGLKDDVFVIPLDYKTTPTSLIFSVKGDLSVGATSVGEFREEYICKKENEVYRGM